MVGDYDYDSKTDVAVFRRSNGVWYVLNSSNSEIQYQQWGLATDIPVPGNYDRSSSDAYDFTVFRPSEGRCYILRGEGTQIQYNDFGLPGDIPVSSLSAIIR